MGFIFNFTSNEVINPLQAATHRNIRFQGPNIFSKNKSLHNLNNVLIFDMEPFHETISNSSTPGHYFIPNIREFSYIYIPDDFPTGVANVDIENNYKCECIKTTHSFKRTIKKFCEIYERYNYPTLIAHNGNNFDFLILIASIYRYTTYGATFVSKMKFFDSYALIKKRNFIHRGNIDMFLKYLHLYKDYTYLQYEQHTSLADCKMLLLWLSKI
nr:hypothetical protein MmNV_58 [Menippe mercenaria nudivirus]